MNQLLPREGLVNSAATTENTYIPECHAVADEKIAVFCKKNARLSRVIYWNQPKMRQKYGFYPNINMSSTHSEPLAYLGQRIKL
jgi:hypothetical protein